MKEKLDTSRPTHIEAHNFFFLNRKTSFFSTWLLFHTRAIHMKVQENVVSLCFILFF